MSPLFQATLPSGRLLSGPIMMDNYHLGDLLIGEVRAPAQIRERRLLRAMKVLTQPSLTGRPRVSAVAYATGFSDEKTFGRAFKRRLGFLPRETEMGSTVWGRTADAQPVLQSWLKELAA